MKILAVQAYGDLSVSAVGFVECFTFSCVLPFSDFWELICTSNL